MLEIKFKSAQEMYDLVNEGVDIYNYVTNDYVFLYNDYGSLCAYTIDLEDAKKLQDMAEENDDYWCAFLGVGGRIYDTLKYEDNPPPYDMAMEDLCEPLYAEKGWILCSDVSQIQEIEITEVTSVTYKNEKTGEAGFLFEL